MFRNSVVRDVPEINYLKVFTFVKSIPNIYLHVPSRLNMQVYKYN
jgi:hypothetical protein